MAPKWIVHQRERACGKSVKTALSESNPRAARGGARKLDRGFHAFAAAAAEIDFFQSAAGQLAQAPREVAGNFWHVTLQHSRPMLVHFVFERLNDVRMVVACIVDAVSR